MDESTRRTRLADRFINYPLIAMLILSPAFALTLGALVLVGVITGLCISRIWVTSPPGFAPKVKISAIDKIQSGMLRRQAVKCEAAGQWEQAYHAWQSSVANNQADAGILSEALKSFLRLTDLQPTWLATSMNQALWLMRLTGTNAASLDIAGEVFLKCNVPGPVYEMLRDRQGSLSPSQEVSFLKALFLTGRANEYWEKRRQVEHTITSDAELDLYHAAYLSGWGPPETISQARKKLTAAQDDQALRTLACRLEMRVAIKLHEPNTYARALNLLQQEGTDCLDDHAGYWQLLEASGRLGDARKLAESYPHPPAGPWDVMRFGNILISLGANDYAQRFFARYVPLFANSDDPEIAVLWVTYADLLIQARKWDELQALATEIRTSGQARTVLAGYSHFIEGRALLAARRPEGALASFQRAAAESFPVPSAGMQTAVNLLRLGYPEFAERVLVSMEKDLGSSAEYWQVLFEAVYALKEDEAMLLRAATKARNLAPDKGICGVNYAAALLINRQAPAEAANLTLAFLKDNPNSLVARVNHCFALAMNRRFTEATAILNTINPAGLDELQSTVFYLCWLEIHAGQTQFDLAREDLKRIDTKHLFPSQVKWIEETRRKLDSAG